MEKLDHKKEEEPLLLMYLEEPGRTAEMYGPESPEMTSAIEKVDNFIGTDWTAEAQKIVVRSGKPSSDIDSRIFIFHIRPSDRLINDPPRSKAI